MDELMEGPRRSSRRCRSGEASSGGLHAMLTGKAEAGAAADQPNEAPSMEKR